jgi:hypothetical protein
VPESWEPALLLGAEESLLPEEPLSLPEQAVSDRPATAATASSESF